MAHISDGYKITTATNFEEIEKIRNAWEGMQNHPNSDIDHYLNVINSRSNVIRPHVILLTHNSRPISLVVGTIEKSPFALKLGGKKVYSPTVKSFTIIYRGLLGDLSNDSCMLLFQEIMRVLGNREVDLVRMNYLEVNSNMYKLAAEIPGILSRDRFPVVSTHWRMSAPESIEAFYKSRSSKHRYWLRRMGKLLEREFPDQVKHVTYADDRELSRIFTDAEHIAQKTYQRGLHVGFIDNEQTRKIYTHIVKKGGFRAYFTYIKNQPCAFWIGERYGDTFYLYSTGYDSKFRKYELGTVLFVKMLDDLCSLGDIKYLDFGFGDAPYKSRFGDESWQEAIVHIFSTNFNGLKLNMLRILTSGISRLLIGILKRLNLLEKIKRSRRVQLTKKSGKIKL